MQGKLSGWDDTIVALATPPGIGAIGIIRLSGAKAIDIVNDLFPSKDLTSQPGYSIHVGLLKDGDEIHIDVDQYILSVNLTDEEVAKRKAAFVPLKKEITSRWLGQYRSLVTNASSGAVLKTDLY